MASNKCAGIGGSKVSVRGPTGPAGPPGPPGTPGRPGNSDPFIYQTSDLNDVTVLTNFVVLNSAQLPTITTAAVGNVTSHGLVVAAHGGTFGTHSLAQVAGKHALAPKNLCLVIDTATKSALTSADDKIVYGLLQTESSVNGHVITDTTPTRLQISFVQINATFDGLEAVPAIDLAGPYTATFTHNLRDKSPTIPEDAFVGGAIAGAGGGGGAGGGSGWIYVEDLIMTSGGTASSKVYQDPPANTVLQSVTASNDDFSVRVRASYPLVNINGVDGEIARDITGGYYRGDVAITLAASGDVIALVKTPDGDAAAEDTVAITLDLPPNVTSALFTGPYPTGPNLVLQTELKENDAYSVAIVADKLFDLVEIYDYEASKFVSTPVAPTLSTTVAIQAADRGDVSVARPARVRVRDAVTAAYSATRDTDFGGGTADGVNLVYLNDLRPSGSVSGIAYPISQSALKGVEAATVTNTATNYDTILYSDPNVTDQITIASPTVFAGLKAVTATGLTIFNNSTTNFSYLMTRDANGAQTTVNAIVVIAGVAPTITVTEPFSRLRSGGNNGTAVQSYTITLSSNQPLLAAPTLNADSGGQRGTFLGVWAAGPSVWTRSLTVSELLPDEKGTFTWEGLVATGLAGLVQNTISGSTTYTLGGFIQRTLSFAPFTATTSIGTSVTDFAKLTAGIFTQTTNAALKQPIGTLPSVTDGYTIDALNVNPTTLTWLDTLQVGANSTGLATITNVEETI